MIEDAQFIVFVKESICIAEVLRKMNLDPSGGHYVAFKQRIERLNLDISHFLGNRHLL